MMRGLLAGQPLLRLSARRLHSPRLISPRLLSPRLIGCAHSSLATPQLDHVPSTAERGLLPGQPLLGLSARGLLSPRLLGCAHSTLATPPLDRVPSTTKHAHEHDDARDTSAQRVDQRYAKREPEALDHAAFTEEFLGVVRDQLPAATDPAKSATLLRELVRSRTLLYTDMRDAPEKFFLAHRLLSSVGLNGFGVRFTVQFNLFAGSVLGLGGEEHLAQLDGMQRDGRLGCFLLTEKQAGVLSGLIVETTATWDKSAQEFRLHTPSDTAAKNWISQGYAAEMGVVIADLRVGGVSHGPHPFLMRMRDERGALLRGIRVEDMGHKTTANDLDNARVWFDDVRLPKSALLSKFADIDEHDAYVQVRADERMRIEVIGQRLLTGRLAIAEAALVCALGLHKRTQAYAQHKVCNGIAGERSLASMPQLDAVFERSYAELESMARFTAGVESRLNECLRAGTIPSAELVDAISVAKIKCIEVAVERVHALRQEVGSYALMHGTGFELADMLLCCKFAEGDSRILQQKLARDRLKALKKGGLASMLRDLLFSTADARREVLAALGLARKLAPAGRDVRKLGAAMDASWREVYGLAELIAARHVRTGDKGEFCEQIVDRLLPAATTFDAEWKARL